MRTRRVFMVGEESVMALDAKKLARLFFPGAQIQAVSIAIENAMDGMSNDELDTLVFLGHSNGMEYGPYDAKAFAKQIASHFKKNEAQKQHVHHLYLVGCEMGLINERGESLSQSIADYLAYYGFKNAVIHSIAKPEGSVGESLYVEVITHVGLRGGGSSVEEGCLNAYLFSQQDGDTFFELIKDKRKNARMIDQFKSEHAFEFLNGAHPFTELNKPHNTFMPNENLEARRYRISQHPYTHQSNEQALAIRLLANRRDHERRKKNDKIAAKLEFIIIQLERAEADKWQALLAKYRDYFGLKLGFVELNRKSNTLKLINYLCDGHFALAEKIIAEQVDKLPKGLTMLRSGKSKSKTKQVVTFAELPHEKTPLLKEREVKESHVETVASQKSAESKSPVTNFKDNIAWIEAKQRVSDMIGLLTKEIAGLSAGCFPFLNRYEIHTKVIKKTALEQLLISASLSDMQQSIRTMTHENPRVLRSWRSSRTARLFEMILNHPDELYQVGLVRQRN